jgi:U3 small nucleolar RNA-associated protein 13
MDQPRRLLKLFTQVRSTASEDPDSLTGSHLVDTVIKSLNAADLRQMLSYVKDWNTVARTSEVAQAVLNAILRFHSATFILGALEGPKVVEEIIALDDMDDEEDGASKKPKEKKKKELKGGEILGALIPYTERHFGRAQKMVTESFIVDHLLGMMESFDEMGGEMEVDE